MPEPLRMERESVLRCEHCQKNPYILYRRQVAPASVAYESVLWPAHPDIAPPRNPEKITCPDCGDELRRVTG